jgi:NADPH:quinone reductase-like Zn-dependent oxidoreductase
MQYLRASLCRSADGVRDAAIGLNPVDRKVLCGDLVIWQVGKLPGVDRAGVMVAVADDAARGWLGPRVVYHMNLHTQGSFSEYTPVAALALMLVPPDIDFTTAASVPFPALTAWLALDKLPTRARARALISGAGGGVGLYAVQLETMRGFDVSVMCHPCHWPKRRARRECMLRRPARHRLGMVRPSRGRVLRGR